MPVKSPPVQVEVDGRPIQLTNLEKPLWPMDGYTKADLIRYHAAVAPILLPHLAGRPLTLTRYPDGIDGESFYQKDSPGYTPEWIRTFPVFSKDSNRIIRYIVAEEPATLTWLANQACIEIHPWMSKTNAPEHPDVAIIDLDPTAPAGFEEARWMAFQTRRVLDEMGLTGFPKLSGATGIHIYIPVMPRYTYAITSGLVGVIGSVLSQRFPHQATNERLVRNRKGVYIDHLQNLPGKTIVAPYSPRPLPGAPVSTPVTWAELERVRPEAFTLATVPTRIDRVGDLFAPVLTEKQSLDPFLPSIEEWRSLKSKSPKPVLR